MKTAKPAFEEAGERAFARYGLEPSSLTLELEEPRISVSVEETGAGEPVLFLHGLGLSNTHWAPIIARLDSIRAVAVDMPGHAGSSSVDFRGVDLRRWHSRMLVSCLDELDIDAAHFVGHSYGGMMGLWLALDAPERVSSVISIGCPSIAFGAVPDFMFRSLAMPGLGPLMLKSPMPGFAHRALVANSVGRPAVNAAPTELLRSAYLGTRRPGFATTASTFLREQFRGMRAAPQRYQLHDDELKTIERPVLIVWGDRDTNYQSAEEAKERARLIPRTQFAIVPGGHEPWLDDIGASVGVISKFLGRVDQAEVA